MITTSYTFRNDAAHCAMPFSGRHQAGWLSALPAIKGDVSVQGTAVLRDRFVAAGLTFPGTTAWSPPT
jgi:hypothetical protein